MTTRIDTSQQRPSITASLVSSLTGIAGARILGAINGLLVARLLEPGLRGKFALAVVIGSCASMVLTGGLQFWIAVEVSASHSAKTVTPLITRHAIAAATLLFPTTLISVAIAAVYTSHDDALFILLIAFYAASSALQLLALAAPNGDRNMNLVALSVTGTAALNLVFLLALLTSNVSSITWALTFTSLSNIFGALLTIPSWKRLHRAEPTPGWIPTTWRSAVSKYLGSGVGELAFLGMLRLDVVLLAAFRPLSEVGLYAVATSTAEVLWVVPDGVAQIVLPMGVDRSLSVQIPTLIRLSMLFTSIGAIVLTAISPALISLLFGQDYEPASAAVPFLALASLGAAAWKLIGGDVAARGNPNVRLSSAVAGLTVMLFVDVITVPRLGIVGASIGSAIGYMVAATIIGRHWKTSTDFHGSLIGIRRADLQLLSARFRSPAKRDESG